MLNVMMRMILVNSYIAMSSSNQSTQFHAFYADHHRWLESWLFKKVGCSHQAEDITQDTFLRLLLKKLETYQFSTPRTYLVHIAKGLVIDYWRRQQLEKEYLDALVAAGNDTINSVELQAIVIQTLVEIDAMLDQLAPKVRQTFLLAQIDGLAYKEIGEIMGVSERMVKKYMATALMHCILYKRKTE